METARPSLARALALSAGLCLAACTTIPGFPAHGELGGERLETTVDSELARYYLEKYLQGKNEDAGMHSRIDAVHRRSGEPLPSREELGRISREMSVDFAALFLAHRLLANRCNRDLNRSFVHYLADKNAGRGSTR